MTAEEKLDEARFFVDKLKQPLTSIEVRHLFSAYLNSISSIFDHLLEDANQKFFVGVSLDENLDTRKFRMIVEYSGNIKAKRFIDWYDNFFKKIRKTNSGKIFHIERNLSTHRRIQTPILIGRIHPLSDDENENMTFHFVSNLSDKEAQKIFDKDRTKFMNDILKRRLKSGKSPIAFLTSFGFELPNRTNTDLVEECMKFLHLMEKFVNESKQLLV